MNPKEIFQLLKNAYTRWDDAKASRLGAALAYYTVFSLAPLLLIGIAIAGVVFGPDAAEGRVGAELTSTVGAPVAEAVQSVVKSAHQDGGGTLAAVVGVGVLLFGASGVFAALQDALNTIWGVAPKPDRGIMGLVRDRFLSFGMVLGTGFLLLVSLILSTALTALGAYLTPGSLPGGALLWQALNQAVSFGVITLLFALIYKTLPDATISWHHVWVGASLTAILFTLGKYLLGLYITHGSVASGYGAAGSLMVILLWVYYSAQILLYGAALTRAYVDRYGGDIRPTGNAVAISPETHALQGAPHAPLAPSGKATPR